MEEVAQNPVKEDSWSPKTRFGRFLDRYFTSPKEVLQF